MDSSLLGEVLRPVVRAVSFRASWVVWRLRSVDEGGVVASGAGGDVVVTVVVDLLVFCVSLSLSWSIWTRGCFCASGGVTSTMG